MQKTRSPLPEIKLVGLTARTSNQQEMDPSTAQIGLTFYKYVQDACAEKIQHRKNPGTTYCVYTDYESDHTGDYTYFIGEEVTSFDNLPEGFKTHTIVPQTYSKFTTEPGTMPQVVINAWQQIWQMEDKSMGGKRRYLSDFEVYDERAADFQKAVVDIYIGIEG